MMIPGNGGGSNWGGVAIDPERQLLFANVMDLPWEVTLYPRDEFEAARAEKPGIEHGPQLGTSWGMRRDMLTSGVIANLGAPCNPPPWGTLSAIDLRTAEIRWTVPIGDVPLFGTVGLPNSGGPIVTETGLVFLAATFDSAFRAFDVDTGEVLWKTTLPAGGQAVPMTYAIDGRQIVVIAAGGYGRIPIDMGATLVAFALPAD